MKSVFIGFMLIAFSVSVASAGDITAHGMYQGDVYTYLSNTATIVNEIKSDHNSSFGNYTGSVDLVNELKTDYNALFANYTGLINKFNNFTSLAEMKAYIFQRGSATAVTSSSAGGGAGSIVTSSDLSLTGL